MHEENSSANKKRRGDTIIASKRHVSIGGCTGVTGGSGKI